MSIVNKAIDKLKGAREGLAPGGAAHQAPGAARAGEVPGKQAMESPPETAGDAVSTPAEVWRRAGLLSPHDDIAKGLPAVRSVKQDVLRHVDVQDDADGAYSRRVLVTSALPGDGKSFVSANLALSLAAERDYETLLIDGDVAMRHLTRSLGMEDLPGVLDLLRDPSRRPGSVIHSTSIPRLLVLSAGTWSDDAPDLLAGDHLARLMEQLMEGRPRRIAVIDSSPVLVSPDSRLIAEHTGQVLFVVRAAETLQRDVKLATGMLKRENRRLAVVLNQLPPADVFDSLVGHRQEGYGYGYGPAGAAARGASRKG